MLWSHGLRAFYGFCACVYDILTTGSQKPIQAPYGICKARTCRGIVQGMRAHAYGIKEVRISRTTTRAVPIWARTWPVCDSWVACTWPVHGPYRTHAKQIMRVPCGNWWWMWGHSYFIRNQMCFIFKLTYLEKKQRRYMHLIPDTIEDTANRT